MSTTAKSIDLFWSFRSPYCYLALNRILDIRDEFNVVVHPRHVWPGAMRRRGYFSRLNPNYPSYQGMDAVRMADYLGVSFARPKPDPLKLDRDTLEPAPEQPLIEPLTRMGVLAAEQGQGMDFINQIMRLLWNGQTPGWNEEEHLSNAVKRAGLNFEDLQRRAKIEAARLDSVIEVNGEALKDAGHWGVPCLVLNGEPFFGQDRLDVLKWRLDQG